MMAFTSIHSARSWGGETPNLLVCNGRLDAVGFRAVSQGILGVGDFGSYRAARMAEKCLDRAPPLAQHDGKGHRRATVTACTPLAVAVTPAPAHAAFNL
jgi:hypothetical protein